MCVRPLCKSLGSSRPKGSSLCRLHLTRIFSFLFQNYQVTYHSDGRAKLNSKKWEVLYSSLWFYDTDSFFTWNCPQYQTYSDPNQYRPTAPMTFIRYSINIMYKPQQHHPPSSSCFPISARSRQKLSLFHTRHLPSPHTTLSHYRVRGSLTEWPIFPCWSAIEGQLAEAVHKLAKW